MFASKAMSGGGGPMYGSDSVIWLTRMKDKDGKEVIGNIIHCRNHKSRLTRENKMVDVKLSYDTGLDRYYGLIDLACKFGVWKKLDKKVTIGDGSKHFQKEIYKKPEKYFTKEVLDAIESHCAEEFKYGSAVDIDNEEQEEE